MKNTKQAIALASAAALSVGMLAGCGGAASSAATASSEGTSTATAEASTTAASDGTLVLAETGFESKFSPFFAASASDQDVIDLTQIALLGADRKGEMVLNGIEGETREYNGTDYTYHGPADCVVTENADGTVTYDIKLREDLKFSDGEPITIDDVIFSMYVLCDPTYDGNSTLFALPIQGMDAYRSGMDTLYNLMLAAGRDNTDFSKWKEADQTAFWADVDQAGVKFVQDIMQYCIAEGANAEGDSVAACMKNWGYDLPADATEADAFNAILAKYDTLAEIVDDTDYTEAGELVAAAKALKPADFADNDEYDALQDAIDAVEKAMADYKAAAEDNEAVENFTDAYETWLATLAAKYNWTEGMKAATAAALESYLAETDPADLDPALFTDYSGETAGDDEHNPMYAAALNIYDAQTAANSSIDAAQAGITVTNAEKADLAAAATAAKAAIAAASTVKDIEAAEAIYGDAYNKVWTDRVASATAKIEAVDGKSFKNHEAITEANVKEAAGLSASDLTVWKSFSIGSQDMNGNVPVAVELGYTAYGDTSDTTSTVRISVINQYKADNPTT